MFFFTKGSLKNILTMPLSIFNASSQCSGPSTSHILAGNNIYIWHVEQIHIDPLDNSQFILKVFDGLDKVSVHLDKSLNSLVKSKEPEEDFDEHNSTQNLRQGSVILVKGYSIVREESEFDTSDSENIVLTISNLVCIGFVLVDDCKLNQTNVSLYSHSKSVDLHVTHKISQLKPSLKNSSWSMMVTLKEKTPIREFVNRQNGVKGRLCRLLLQDSSGFIEAVIFNDLIERLNFDDLIQDNVYMIRNGQIKYGSKMMRSWPDQVSLEFELLLTDQSIITHVTQQEALDQFNQKLPKRKRIEIDDPEEDDDIQSLNHMPPIKIKKQSSSSEKYVVTKLHKSFTTLDQVYFLPKDSLTSVLAVVKEVGKLKTLKSARVRRPLSLLNITVTDKSNCEMNVAIWGKQAEDFEMPIGSVIMLKECQVTNYNGVSLSVIMKTFMLEMQRSNDIQYVSELFDWWESKNTSQ